MGRSAYTDFGSPLSPILPPLLLPLTRYYLPEYHSSWAQETTVAIVSAQAWR